MKISIKRMNGNQSGAYTLVEVLCSVFIAAFLFATVYVGIAQGFMVTQVARENLRATQILQEKMEQIRLYTWEQIKDYPKSIPAGFDEPYYPNSTQSTGGLVYHGTVTITNVQTMTEAYEKDHKLVIVDVKWTSGNIERTRTMTTFVSHYGLHNYVY